MNELLSALANWLADVLILATALLAVAGLVMWRLKQPAQRMALAWATMAGLTALIVATAVPAWPRWDVRQWLATTAIDGAGLIEKPTITYQERVSSLSDDALPPAIENVPLPDPIPLPTLPATTAEQQIDWPAAAALAWFTCAAAALGWIALGALQAWRLLWTAAPSPLWAQTELARLIGRRKKPRLKTSTRIGSAVALGALRPAILLPAEHVREDNLAGVQAALAHEWAHIRHGDLWLLAWQRLLLPLLVVHPLFWFLRRQIRADQELLADVAAAGERPVEYAEALLAWAKQAGPRPSAGLAALAMWENPQTVSRRIQMILDPKNPVVGKTSRWWRWLLALSLIALAGGLSLLSVRSGPAVAQEAAPAAGPGVIETKIRESQPLSFFFGQTSEHPPTAQIQQVELSVAMVHLGKAGEKATKESIRDMAKHFGDQIAFDSGVCVVALPRQQVASAIKTLHESGEAKLLSQPKLMTIAGREAYLADGGELPSIRETDFGDRRIERIEFQSLRSLRIRPEVRTQHKARASDPRGGEASVIRLAVTRERIEPINGPDPNNETEKTRPRMITRQLTFTADVPIGRTLLVWELQPPADDEANLVLITPEGIHRVTREVLANPRPLALDFAFPTAQPAEAPMPVDPPAVQQMKGALEKLRAEAESNARLRADMQRETARLKQRIDDLMTQLAWLRSVANQDSQDQVTDAVFIRRVYLDLLGIVPAVDDVKAFLDSSDAKKREKLIDKLLADDKVADHWAQTWKDLIAQRQVTAAEPKGEKTASPPAPDQTVRVIRLRHMESERAAELLKEMLKGNPGANARVAADPRTNSVLLHGGPQESASLAQILEVLDQPAAAPGTPHKASADDDAGHDPATQRQLLEIDLQAADTELDLAKVEHSELQKMGPGAVSAHELRRKEAALRQAELRVRRIKILLDAMAAKENAPARSPLHAIQEAMVLPKNLRERIWQTLGLNLEPREDDSIKRASPFRGGLAVIDVRPDSPADERGLVKGDVLVGLGRWEMRSLENVIYALEHLGQGDLPSIYSEGDLLSDFAAPELSFHILRDGKVLVGRMPLAPSKAGRSPASAEPATPDAAGDRVTRLRLAEIDLREAKLKLEAFSKEHARIAELAKQSSVPQAEVDRIVLERQHAELAVERAQIVLEGLKSQPATPKSR